MAVEPEVAVIALEVVGTRDEVEVVTGRGRTTDEVRAGLGNLLTVGILMGAAPPDDLVLLLTVRGILTMERPLETIDVALLLRFCTSF